ncbi:unnamed protein product [Paramecium octaurelia]|uniref:Uncharacterized protein n=1 Tax=Paramecium octaurelia TaxID=43137 RepID=A0A8S1SFC1_PAROT|nr:unnamed protein product [Paramecium octaurelia]
MIKLCQNLKNYFSSSFFPYNPKGYQNIQQYIQHHQTIKIKLTEFDVSKDQFIFAYNNFIDSILEDDFNIYAQQVCDKKLADEFIEGVSRIKREQLKIEKMVNPEIQEEIYFSDMNFFVNVDRGISLYDHSEVETVGKFPKFTQLHSEKNELLNCFSFGAFIKSKFALKISDIEYEPENFHYVRFMVLKDQEELKSLFKTIKSLLVYNEKEIYLGDNPSWKIIDVDRNMEKKYPQYF